MELRLNGLQSAYVELVRYVMKNGKSVDVRGHHTLEITNATLVFGNVRQCMIPVGIGRGVNLKLAAVEALQLIAGVSVPSLVLGAAPEFVDVLVDSSDMDYAAYGPRLSGQLYDVVQILTDDPTSRQAVAAIWRAEDLTHQGDRPCTIFMQFLIRDEQLELHVYMRSNDVWLGVPYDIFAFTQLQHTVARALQRATGQYVHHATSLHLYERDLERADRLMWDPHTAPTDVLPRGVKEPAAGGKRDWHTLRTTASFLCADRIDSTPSIGPVSMEIRERNDWYVQQLGRIPDLTPIPEPRHE